MKRDNVSTEMTRISFSKSPPRLCRENTKWIADVVRFYESPRVFNLNLNCLRILDLNYMGLTDECLGMLCHALWSRKGPLVELEYLLLLNNTNITDECTGRLLDAIDKSCVNLRHLNLRRCNIGDVSCALISKYMIEHQRTTKIRHIDLEFNTKITKMGTDKIHKMFNVKNRQFVDELVIHYGANKKSYCWECRTLYDQ